jgi:hypothetical protein
MKYTNNEAIPLSLAVFLATDNYAHNDDPKTISTTSLLKPLKQIILATRTPKGSGMSDISTKIASCIGTAIHSGLEASWANNHKQAMTDLGYPKKIVDAVRINPSKEELDADDSIIPVYLEIRTNKLIAGWTISGQFDLVLEGKVHDLKTTGTYSYISKSNDTKYIQQASIYRWLNPTIITDNVMSILFAFTDWSKLASMTQKDYPKSKLLEQSYNLMSLPETEMFIKNKLALINKHLLSAEADIPECSKEDLWEGETKWKYYKDPNKTARSTKNFSDPILAHERLMGDGGVGIVKEIRGKVKACNYCDCSAICSQFKKLQQEGRLA